MAEDPDVTADEAAQTSTAEAGAVRDFLKRYGDLFPDLGPEPKQGPFPLPAVCDNGHEFADKKYGTIADRAQIFNHTPIGVKCPECEGHAEIAAGRYFIRDGQVVREDITDEDERD
jgi:hypothetical protein